MSMNLIAASGRFWDRTLGAKNTEPRWYSSKEKEEDFYEALPRLATMVMMVTMMMMVMMMMVRGKRRGFLRGTSSAGQQWPAIAMVGGETGNPIYTFLPNNQPTLAICKTIYSDHQALQEHAYNPHCGQNSQNTRCGQKSQQRVVFRTRASRSCGKTYNLCIYAHSEHMWSKYENLLDLLWRTTGEGIKNIIIFFRLRLALCWRKVGREPLVFLYSPYFAILQMLPLS